MTLDVIDFIDSKGGNAEEIRESQRKRGDSVELVDEIVRMYAEWVKSEFRYRSHLVGKLIRESSGLWLEWIEKADQCFAKGNRFQEESEVAVYNLTQVGPDRYRPKRMLMSWLCRRRI
jgi:hypothetical protein